MDGALRYTCEATSLMPPNFTWEAFDFGGMIITLHDDDPSVPFEITTTLDAMLSTSTLTYQPDIVDFSDPSCLIEDGLSLPLRVESDEFTSIGMFFSLYTCKSTC